MGQRVHTEEINEYPEDWKVLRHRIRRFPTFFVDGGDKVVGWEGDPDGAVRRALAQRVDPIPREVRA